MEQKEVNTYQNYPEIKKYFETKKILEVTTLNSKWRKENLLLKIDTNPKSYVFKKINSKDKEEEINRVKLMSKEYPDLFPQIYFLEKDAYLMDYIEGKTFFDLNKNEKIRNGLEKIILLPIIGKSGLTRQQRFRRSTIRFRSSIITR